jgi:uncharacterized membrane protein
MARTYNTNDIYQATFVADNQELINKPSLPSFSSLKKGAKDKTGELYKSSKVFDGIIGTITAILVLVITIVLVVLTILRVSSMSQKDYATFFILLICLATVLAMNMEWFVSKL